MDVRAGVRIKLPMGLPMRVPADVAVEGRQRPSDHRIRSVFLNTSGTPQQLQDASKRKLLSPDALCALGQT